VRDFLHSGAGLAKAHSLADEVADGRF